MSTTDEAAAAAAGREARLADLLERGVAAALASHRAGAFPVEHGLENQDRVVMGSPLPLAHALLRRGDAASVAEAVGIVSALLDAQERHPRHPHRGNWPRFVGDDEITDLNSAPFITKWLLPLLIDVGDRLPRELLGRCRDGVRLALEEIVRLDVAPTYTNIHLMGIFALVVGGAWLGDARIEQTGLDRWARWVRYTVESGAPREYNSSTYLGMDLTVLAKLAGLATDPAIRLQARLMYERVLIHAVVHLHRPTGQLSGPQARCYWGGMLTGRERLQEILWRETGRTWPLETGPYAPEPTIRLPIALELAQTPYMLPAYIDAWLEAQAAAMPFEVRETASAGEGHDLTTYLAPGFALGTASRTYSADTGILAIEQMANHLMLHYAVPREPGPDGAARDTWGMMYARYVVNDQALGTLGSFPGRQHTNFFDQGHFAGVQRRGRAIALYALRPLLDTYVTSLKTVVAFQSGDALEAVWINDRRVAPGSGGALEPGDWLIVEDGAVLIGVRALEATWLGREAPIRLERGPLGELWLAIYNYRGSPKRLWDHASLTGAYWRGNIRAGFLVEVAERTEAGSAATFLARLRASAIEDTVDAAGVRTVAWRHGGDELAIDFDLRRTEPGERRFDGQPYRPPSLQSPLCVQGAGGTLAVGQATLEAAAQPLWLVVQELDPAERTWVVVNPEAHPTPITLRTPDGELSVPSFGLGRIEWRSPVGGRPSILIETAGPVEAFSAPPGIEVRSIVAGRSP